MFGAKEQLHVHCGKRIYVWEFLFCFFFFFFFSDDVLGILELPDLKAFQEPSNFNNSLDLGPLSNSTPAPPPSMGNSGVPHSNMELGRPGGGGPVGGVAPHMNSTQNSLAANNMTPPPNAVISTSGDPTPTLPAISSSPIHTAPATAPASVSPYSMGGPQGYQQLQNHMPNMTMNPNINPGGMNPHFDTRGQYHTPNYNPGMVRGGGRFPVGNPGIQQATAPHPASSIGEFMVVRPQVQPNYQYHGGNPATMGFNPNMGPQAHHIPNRQLPGTADHMPPQQHQHHQQQQQQQQTTAQPQTMMNQQVCYIVYTL